MAKEWAKSFYKSKAWRECRQAYYISKHGLCEKCGEPGEEVHHTTHLTQKNINDPNITLNWDMLILLCKECHNKEHERFKSAEVTRDGLEFDSNGQLVHTPL